MVYTRCPGVGCGQEVSPLGSHVYESGKTWHITCWVAPRIKQATDGAVASIRAQIAAEEAQAREAEQARQRAQSEQMRAQQLARENIERERQRIATLEQREREKLKSQSAGEGKDRFELIETE